MALHGATCAWRLSPAVLTFSLMLCLLDLWRTDEGEHLLLALPLFSPAWCGRRALKGVDGAAPAPSTRASYYRSWTGRDTLLLTPRRYFLLLYRHGSPGAAAVRLCPSRGGASTVAFSWVSAFVPGGGRAARG